MVQGNHTIGLNEVEVGIPVPKWLEHAMISAIGYREAERALMRFQNTLIYLKFFFLIFKILDIFYYHSEVLNLNQMRP